ncbi:hypothetical protein K449DRAFT_437064 [Hypoxylon sp. EC38]|nr:hypothetical protein K449DRAFT_437064 [Hypoxylon sp. EC38]
MKNAVIRPAYGLGCLDVVLPTLLPRKSNLSHLISNKGISSSELLPASSIPKKRTYGQQGVSGHAMNVRISYRNRATLKVQRLFLIQVGLSWREGRREGRASYGYVPDPPKYTIAASSQGYKNTILMEYLDCERQPAMYLKDQISLPS